MFSPLACALAVLRLYPRAWRARYGDEVRALIEESGATWWNAGDVAAGCLTAWWTAAARSLQGDPRVSRLALVVVLMIVCAVSVPAGWVLRSLGWQLPPKPLLWLNFGPALLLVIAAYAPRVLPSLASIRMVVFSPRRGVEFSRWFFRLSPEYANLAPRPLRGFRNAGIALVFVVSSLNCASASPPTDWSGAIWAFALVANLFNFNPAAFEADEPSMIRRSRRQ